MLKPEQIDSLRDTFEKIAEPINDYIIKDIVDRILEAGQVTGTARRRAEVARLMRVSVEKVERYLKEECEAREADFSYWFNEIVKLMFSQSAIPIEQDTEVQQIVFTALKLANAAFENLTQTLGMIGPYGQFLPLRDVYINVSDYAYNKVVTGAATYREAMLDAVRNLADYGVQSIDYQSGRHYNLDVAIRRNIFGGMGLMVEQVENHIAQEMQSDGWEISAHEASAEDHEPYQGRQYSNEDFQVLNNSLKRRIGTLNCKHMAFPIILGVSEPIYTEEQLKEMAERNKKGIDYEGKHYSLYEATQMQRLLERNIRKQKRRIVAYSQSEETAKELQKAQIRYRQLDAKYREFSGVASMPVQEQRLEVLGFGNREHKQSVNAYKPLAN